MSIGADVLYRSAADGPRNAAQALKSRAILVNGMRDERVPIFACADIEYPVAARGFRFDPANLNLEHEAGKSTI